MDGERAPAGPAGWPADPLDRGVRVERRVPADLLVCLSDEQWPVAGVRFQVEQVGKVGREDVGRDLFRVLAVRSDHDGTDRSMIRWHRAADEQGILPAG